MSLPLLPWGWPLLFKPMSTPPPMTNRMTSTTIPDWMSEMPWLLAELLAGMRSAGRTDTGGIVYRFNSSASSVPKICSLTYEALLQSRSFFVLASALDWYSGSKLTSTILPTSMLQSFTTDSPDPTMISHRMVKLFRLSDSTYRVFLSAPRYLLYRGAFFFISMSMMEQAEDTDLCSLSPLPSEVIRYLKARLFCWLAQLTNPPVYTCLGSTLVGYSLIDVRTFSILVMTSLYKCWYWWSLWSQICLAGCTHLSSPICRSTTAVTLNSLNSFCMPLVSISENGSTPAYLSLHTWEYRLDCYWGRKLQSRLTPEYLLPSLPLFYDSQSIWLLLSGYLFPFFILVIGVLALSLILVWNQKMSMETKGTSQMKPVCSTALMQQSVSYPRSRLTTQPNSKLKAFSSVPCMYDTITEEGQQEMSWNCRVGERPGMAVSPQAMMLYPFTVRARSCWCRLTSLGSSELTSSEKWAGSMAGVA